MPDSTVPEIKRVNLTSTILNLKSMDINDVIGFDFLDKPDLQTIEDALRQLYYLEAIDKYGVLTSLGRELSQFPLEPTYTKALLTYHYPQLESSNSDTYFLSSDMLILVSVLSSENLWVGVSRTDQDKQDKLEEVKRKFEDKRSDHMALVNLFDAWSRESSGYKEQWCFKNFVQSRALKQALNIKEQL